MDKCSMVNQPDNVSVLQGTVMIAAGFQCKTSVRLATVISLCFDEALTLDYRKMLQHHLKTPFLSTGNSSYC